MLVEDPADSAAMQGLLAGLDDTPSLFDWARRATLHDTLGPVPLRRLLLRAGALDAEALARWAEAAPLPNRHPLRLIGTLVKRREPRRRAQPPHPGTAFVDFERRIDWLRFIAATEPAPSSLASAIEATLIKVAMCRELQEAGLIAEALRAGREASLFNRTVRRRLYGDQGRGFTSNWTQAIGHMVLFIHMLAAQRYGLADWKRTLLEGGRIANPALHAMAEATYGTVTTSNAPSVYCEPHGSLLPEVVGDEILDIFEFCGRVDSMARARGETVLPIPPRAGALDRFLTAHGLAADGPFVTLHCRESGFKLRGRHGARNASVSDYEPAIDALIDRGFTVVRIGDPSMTPLPPRSGLIDYARAPEKSAELDILLPAHAAFHIGTSSGLSLVPLLFGRPCLFTNWYPTNLMPWGRRTRTLMKRLVRCDTGEAVTDSQTLFTIGMVTDETMLEHLGYSLEENSKSEILETVCEFIHTISEGRPFRSPHHFLYTSDGSRVTIGGRAVR